MIDVTSLLVLLVIVLSFSGAGTWLSRRHRWTRWSWFALLALAGGLALASLLWDYQLEIPGSKPLQWMLVLPFAVLLGIGLSRYIRMDAARLRARREGP